MKEWGKSARARLLFACDVIAASAVRDHLYLLGLTPEEQRLLPDVALEVKAREKMRGPLDPLGTVTLIAEVAAGSRSTQHLESLSALLYIAATYTEDHSELQQRLAWARIFRDDKVEDGLGSLDLPATLQSAIGAITDAFRIKTDRLSRLLQEADAEWMAEGATAQPPEHEVDSFLGLAGRRYFLETARIIRFVASDDQVEAIEKMATRRAGFDIRLP